MVKNKNYYMCVYVGFLCPGIFSIIEGTEMTVYEVREKKYVMGSLKV